MRLTWRQVAGLAFATPAIVYFLVFFIYPFLYTAYLSLNKWDLLSPIEFVGLRNFGRMLSDSLLHRSILVTLRYLIGASLGIWVFSLAYALWFNNDFSGKRVYITIFLMACLMGLVPSLMAWRILLHQDYGLFNKIFFYSWGFEGKLNWLNTPRLAMSGIIISSLSTGIPFYAIYLIGAIASVPVEYYEVAKIEGANYFQRLWYVILPTIRPVYLFVIIVSLITGFQYMGPFFVLTRGGPANTTLAVSLYIWNTFHLRNQFGYASAMTLVVLAILIPITYIALRVGGER